MGWKVPTGVVVAGLIAWLSFGGASVAAPLAKMLSVYSHPERVSGGTGG